MAIATSKVEEVHDVVYLGWNSHLARNLCVLICCNDTHVLPGMAVCSRYASMLEFLAVFKGTDC